MVTEKAPQRQAMDPTRIPVLLPCDLETWPLVQGALSRLRKVSSVSDITPILDHVHALIHGNSNKRAVGGRSGVSVFAGLVHFLVDIATEQEREEFLRRTLPAIVDLALALGDLKPAEGFYYCIQQRGSETRLSRRFVASLVAHLLLCTLPHAGNLSLNQTDFATFFAVLGSSKGEDSQTAKLRCILHYFNRLAADAASSGPSGRITFTRKMLAHDEMPVLETWQDSRIQLCPLVLRAEGLIEEAGSNALQVDFANRFIGGGVLGGGCVQEEIRFCICPELLASLVFMESMEDNEAIAIAGFEQFSRYHGYGWGLRYAGDFRDSAQKYSCGDIKTSLVAIDATPMDEMRTQEGGVASYVHDYQYTNPALLRELNKAYIGFLQTQEGSTSNGIRGDVSESLYLDAIDQSQMSTEGDFETASEGLDSLQRPATPSISTISDYSNSLSRAITDIAVKDYCQGRRDQYTQSEPSLDYPPAKTEAEDRMGCINAELNNFASSVAGDVVREGFQRVSKTPQTKSEFGTGDNLLMKNLVNAPPGSTARGTTGQRVDGLAEGMSHSLVADVASYKGGKRSQDNIVWKGNRHYPGADGEGVSPNLSAIIDDIVSVVIKEALEEIAGMCVSESGSPHGPSLEGYSVISTWSSKSDSFVRIDFDSDFSGTRSAGSLSSVGSERVGMSVETYVSNVVAGAVHKMKGGSQKTQEEVRQRESDPSSMAGRIVNGELREVKNKSHLNDEHVMRNSYFKPVVSAGLDAFAASIADAAYKEAIGQVSVSVPLQECPFSQYSTIPSTPPPSPSNASTGSSKRFSLEDPSQLEEFAERLLSSITPEPSSERQQYPRGSDCFQRYQEIEDFASNLVSRAVTDSTQAVSTIGQVRRESRESSGCISSRSSLTVPSGSSKRSSMDSFTEDLLRIGNIDPTGRRPSKTEENITFFSQELARVAEVEEKLSQRRKSDLDDFQQELYQSSMSSNPGQKNEIRIHAASRLANRLSDDIICDAFLQLYGATPFRELIRLDSLPDLDSGGGNRRRSYPRRGCRRSSASSTSLSVRSTISEMDLVTLATNLANTIIESALQTYRDEYLSAQRRSAADSLVDDTDSHLQDTMEDASILATYDGSNMDRLETACASLAGELPPELSIQETAGCIVERAVQDAVDLYQASMMSSNGKELSHHLMVGGGWSRRPIATGNWGCGAFGGDPQLKSLLQWVAASQCRAPSMFYYSFSDDRVRKLEQVTLIIQTKRWSVGDLMRIILEYCHLVSTTGDSGGLFDYILGLQC